MIKVHYDDDHEGLLRLLDGRTFTICETINELRKSAASQLFTPADMDRFRPDKDHFMIHNIIVGDEETYGQNRNGDSWPKEACQSRHHTFVSEGAFYREHRNRSKKQAIGIIKASGFHPTLRRIENIMWGDKEKAEEEFELAKQGKNLSFSMSCFPAGTLVRMSDGSEKRIELLRCGDAVLTHVGREGKVSHTMSRSYTGAGVKLRSYGLSEAIVCTEDHGIWHRPAASSVKACPVCGEKFRGLRNHLRQQKDVKHQAAFRDLPRYCEGFTAAGNLLPGDLVRQAVDHTSTEDADPNWAIVAGYFLAEGNLYRADCYSVVNGKKYGPYDNWRTEFTFNENEEHLIRELQAAVVALGFSEPSVHHYPEGHSKVVRSHSRNLFAWLEEHCGKLSHGKRLSRTLRHWKLPLQKLMLEKWLEGDGTWHDENEVLSGTTVGRQLHWNMMDIAARLGFAAGCHKDKAGPSKREAYIVSFRGTDAAALRVAKVPKSFTGDREAARSLSRLRHQTATLTFKSAKALSFVENGFVYRRLRKVETVFLNEEVYDITVPGDHGFQVHGYGVSNCRVPWDECNCCGNRAKRASAYCDHLKHHMNQYVPEFKKYAFARNILPTFYDDSRVVAPADRIAHYLEYRFHDDDMAKAAAVNRVITGAEWAEFEGVCIPDPEEPQSFDRHKTAMLQLLVNDEAWLNDLNKQAYDSRYEFAKMVSTATPEELNESELNSLRELRPGTLMRELAKRACILPFVTFCAYANGTSVEEARNSDIVKRAAIVHLPGIFTKLQEQGDEPRLGNMFDAASDFVASCDTSFDHNCLAIMRKASCSMSIEPELFSRNFLHTEFAPRPEANIALDKSASVDSEAQIMAEAYAHYQLHALCDMENLHGEQISDAQRLIGVTQNRHVYR